MDKLAPADELSLSLASLRKAGAARWDALGMHYLESLNKRLPQLEGEVQEIVRQKLTHALAELTARFEQAEQASRSKLVKNLAPPTPSAPSLTALVHDLQAHSLGAAPLSALRKNLSTLSVDKQVSQALRQAPQNAGPINSHMLMLRSLELLRELSPAYLQRFMTYADTLMVLEHAGMKKPSTSRPRKAKT
jgi:hypothetical protein